MSLKEKTWASLRFVVATGLVDLVSGVLFDALCLGLEERHHAAGTEILAYFQPEAVCSAACALAIACGLADRPPPWRPAVAAPS